MSVNIEKGEIKDQPTRLGQKLIGFIAYAVIGSAMLVISKKMNIGLNYGTFMKWLGLAFMAFVGANVTNTGLGGFISKMLK